MMCSAKAGVAGVQSAERCERGLELWHVHPCKAMEFMPRAYFLCNPQSNEKPLKDFKQRSDMIRCLASKLSEDHSGWERGGYGETSWEAMLVFKAKSNGSSDWSAGSGDGEKGVGSPYI